MSDNMVEMDIGKRNQYIELHIKPSTLRTNDPVDILERIVKGTGLKVKEPDYAGSLINTYEWQYNNVPPQQWAEIRPTIKNRAEKLHEEGLINFARW